MFGIDNQATVGARAHFEDTNRKRYNGLTPDARERSFGTVLRDDNQIRTSAYALYGQNVVSLGKLRVTPGVRVERIETVNIARAANFVPLDRRAASAQTLVLPGLGVTWLGLQNLTLFAGVHRGFAPPRPDRDFNPNAPFNAVRPERSLETEIGFRMRPGSRAALDLTLFEMRLDDLIVEGPLVGGRSGTFVNAGKALHRGLELSGRIEAGRLRLTGTYTNLYTARFLTDVDESSTGVHGNRVPYAPKKLIDVAVGYEAPNGFGAELGANHVGAQHGNASNTRIASPDGTSGILPPRTIYRLALSFQPPKARFRLFATAENISDQVYISRRVDGLFAGPRRQIVLGISFPQ